MTQEEIQNLARNFVDSLTDRQRMLGIYLTPPISFLPSVTLTSQTRGLDPDTYNEAIDEISDRQEKLLQEVRKVCVDPKKYNSVMRAIIREINGILKKEKTIDVKAEVVETERKPLDGPSNRRLS